MRARGVLGGNDGGVVVFINGAELARFLRGRVVWGDCMISDIVGKKCCRVCVEPIYETCSGM